jgi:hypothetical protein
VIGRRLSTAQYPRNRPAGGFPPAAPRWARSAQTQTTANRTVVEPPAETLIFRSESPSTRHLPGRSFRRTTWLPAGVSAAVKTPTSPLTEPSTPAGSIDTLNVIVSTPGPRLVTPTVTLPDTGGDCGAAFAQAAEKKMRDAETQSRTGR